MVSRKGKPLQSLPPRPRLPCPRAGSGPLVAAGQGRGLPGRAGVSWNQRLIARSN